MEPNHSVIIHKLPVLFPSFSPFLFKHDPSCALTLFVQLTTLTCKTFTVARAVFKSCFFLNKSGLIVSAEPASACNSFATKKEGVDREKDDVIQVSPSLQGACTPGGTNIWTGTPETRPKTEPLLVKWAKMEAGKGEIEEGEIIDSSDEEKEEEEGNTEDNTPCGKSFDSAKSLANDMEVIKDEPADSVDVNVDDGLNKHSDSSRAQCINEDISGSTMTSELSKSAEVSMTKEDAVKDPGPVHTHLCHDENESANAADSCGLE